MAERKKVSRITAVINKAVSPAIVDALKNGGLSDMHIATGRASVLQDKKGPFASFSPGMVIGSDPVEILSLLVSSALEDKVLDFIAEKGQLSTPGRGSVYSEEVEMLQSHALCGENASGNFAPTDLNAYSDLTGICCIVQRGQGDAIARLVLDTGTCAPATTFGEGTGLRDKLGILRITIPAEKEVINLVASRFDAEDVMDMMIDVGKLDQPGKGFIYLYPVKQGFINTKVNRGTTGHAASMEQVIAALDDLKGSVEWRRREAMAGQAGGKKRAYLANLLDMSLVCDEGRGMDLVNAAMSVGAAGATVSRLKYFSTAESTANKVSPARESASMIISEQQIPAILKAIEDAGAFDAQTHGQVFVRPVPKACTYLGK